MDDLAASFAYCRQICQASGSSFFSSFSLLSAQQRDAMYALYAFARITDDLGDSDRSAEEKVADINRWENWLANPTGPPWPPPQIESDALWPAMHSTIARYWIPKELLRQLIEGVRSDLEHQTPASMEELLAYCYQVASTVGLACLQIWREAEEEDLPEELHHAAVSCGYAFQLTNILRDIAEDAERGRCYIPADLLAREGSTPEEWLTQIPPEESKAVVGSIGQTAIEYYRVGWRVHDALSGGGQRMFSLIWRNYRALLDCVLANRSELHTGMVPRLSRSKRTVLGLSHMIPFWYRLLPDPCVRSDASLAGGASACDGQVG